MGVFSLLTARGVAAEPTTAAGWTNAFQNEHNTHWSGGDQSNSIRTTGNHQVYFIHGDTLTMDEQMGAGGSGAGTYIPHDPGAVNNSIVRYLWFGADVVAPATASSEAVPSPEGTHLWGMDLTEANGEVYALLADGTHGVFHGGGYLVKFTENQDGTLTRSTGVAQLPYDATKPVHWNNSLITLNDIIYIYGSDDAGKSYLSKVDASLIDWGFLGSWNLLYYTKSGWDTSQASATPISDHIFRSVRVANGYLVATHRDNGYDTTGTFGAVRTSTDDPQFQSSSRKSKAFTHALVVAGQSTAAGNVANPAYSVPIWTYCPTLHPELQPSSATTLLIGIDWNTIYPEMDLLKNAQAYKPRFFEVSSPDRW
ncbi:MAG TPA: hypothetical protein VJR89_33395 [Polyangiales bacterium]|nr:hypothetical protein [Polyangiales bacterium]